MALAVVSLASMQNDGDTFLVDFFSAWNGELPPSAGAVNDKICAAFVNKHGRGRFNSLFQLSRTLADEVVAASGGSDGWTSTIEQLSGFKFALPTAPTSAHLAGLRSGVPEAAEKPKAHMTLSDTLGSNRAAWEAEKIPAHCYSVVTCACPLQSPLSEPDVSAFTDALLEYIAAKHGGWNLGLPLIRLYAAQTKRKFPHLPDRGQTAGVDRDWEVVIGGKIKNRRYVRTCSQTHSSHPLPAPPSPQPELLSLAEDIRQQAEGQRHRPHRRRYLHGVGGGRAGRPERGLCGAAVQDSRRSHRGRAPPGHRGRDGGGCVF